MLPMSGRRKETEKSNYQSIPRNQDKIVEIEEIECNIDEDLDNEHYTGKNINESFINRLKDFPYINPSGNKGKEKNAGNVSVPNIETNIIPGKKRITRDSLEIKAYPNE